MKKKTILEQKQSRKKEKNQTPTFLNDVIQ